MKRKIETLFDEYSESHQHPINIAIHKVAVPAIVFSSLGILWALPWGLSICSWLNWASIVALVLGFYYWHLSRTLAIGFEILSALVLVLFWWLTTVKQVSLLIPMAVIFLIAWLMQFIGHYIEGKRPSFLKDMQFLLIGPLWVLARVYRWARISY